MMILLVKLIVSRLAFCKRGWGGTVHTLTTLGADFQLDDYKVRVGDTVSSLYVVARATTWVVRSGQNITQVAQIMS